MSSVKEFQHLKISLQDLESATNSYSDANCVGRGGFGKVYKGEILLSGVLTTVAIKRLDTKLGQGTNEFWKEIMMLTQYKHENLVTLVGFCDEGGENILVYEYLSNKSLDLYLHSVDLSWHQRLTICLGAAKGLQYLHEPIKGSPQQRVIHRDIKSANILLDHNWRPKIADFGLSKLGPANQQFTFLISDAVGTMGYCDPLYAHTGFLTKESDAYSFGVVLFEVLCGRPCVLQKYDDIRRSLVALSQKCYEEKKMDTIIPIVVMDTISTKCLGRFSAIAYQCLRLDRAKRPTMGEVVRELEFALNDQARDDELKEIQVATMQKVNLKEIQVATNNFKLFIGKSPNGIRTYKGELSIFGIPTRVHIMRLPHDAGVKQIDYLEIVRSVYKQHHPNIFSALGYCCEEREMIIVYEYPEGESLDQYIKRSNRAYDTTTLTWLQRLQICVGVGRGLSYLLSKYKSMNHFISASNIVLDDKWVAKIATSNTLMQYSTSLDRGADAYNSSKNINNNVNYWSREGNVYSFGIVLFEVLCGRLCTEEVDGYMLSAVLIKELYEKNKLHEIVDPALLRKVQMMSSYSMDKYSAIAYQCLSNNPKKRPSMDVVLLELEELLYMENGNCLSGDALCNNAEESTDHIFGPCEIALKMWQAIGSWFKSILKNTVEREIETMQKIELKEIQVATNNFKSYIGDTRQGVAVYEGRELCIYGIPTRVYIMRSPKDIARTRSDYYAILYSLSKLRHPNYISTLGYCYEEGEIFIVLEYPEGERLDEYIRRSNRAYKPTTFTWLQRLEICTAAGRGLSFLHLKTGCEGAFGSASIVLDDRWVAKIAELGIISTECSTGFDAYRSPEYVTHDTKTQKDDVYAFGLILFEVLCGRLCTEEVDGYMLSPKLIKDLYEKEKLHEIVDPALLREENMIIGSYSVDKYSAIAYQCLSYNSKERPSMADVVLQLEELLGLEKLRLGKQPHKDFNDLSIKDSESRELQGSNTGSTSGINDGPKYE